MSLLQEQIFGAMLAGADDLHRDLGLIEYQPSVRSYKINMIIVCNVYSYKFHHPVQCAQGRK